MGNSPYGYGANNPISNIDMNGDSVIVGASITGNKVLNKAFNDFAGTKSGRKFLSNYAAKGQTINGYTFTADGKYNDKGIDLNYGAKNLNDNTIGGQTDQSIGQNGRAEIDVTLNTQFSPLSHSFADETFDKSFSILLRIFLFFFSLIIVCYNVYAVITQSAHYFGEKDSTYIFVGSVFLIVLISTGLQVLYFPIGVTIDYELKQLNIKYLLTQSKTVLTKDLESYQEVYIKSRVAKYYGIVLKLKDGKQVLCSELNLSNYVAVLNYLQANKVKYTGQADFSFFSYYINQ